MPLHLRLIMRNPEVLARSEQTFQITPWCADQGNAAGKRLEYPNRRDSGEHINIEAAWHMHGREVTREDFRHARIREPPAIVRPVNLQSSQRVLRIAHAVYVEPQARIPN